MSASIAQRVSQWLPGTRKTALPRGEALGLRPIRNPLVTWQSPIENQGAAVHLRAPRKLDWFGRTLSRWLAFPETKVIELDQFGAAIWERCDGAHPVSGIVDFVCAEHKLNRRQGEVSVIAFMKMLAERKLIGFAKFEPATQQKRGGGKSAHELKRLGRSKRSSHRKRR